MTLIQLMYSSRAREGMAYEELTSMLHAAVSRNAAHAITGMLCYTGSAFLQVLEGDRSDVSRLFNRIARDERHTVCELIGVREITSREFRDWSMKLIDLHGALTPERRALLLQHGQGDGGDLRALSSAEAHALLTEFANRELKPNSNRAAAGRRATRVI